MTRTVYVQGGSALTDHRALVPAHNYPAITGEVTGVKAGSGASAEFEGVLTLRVAGVVVLTLREWKDGPLSLGHDAAEAAQTARQPMKKVMELLALQLEKQLKGEGEPVIVYWDAQALDWGCRDLTLYNAYGNA